MHYLTNEHFRLWAVKKWNSLSKDAWAKGEDI